ncbi:MAG: DUF3450 domain-containing protein [Gammaproteobacteria bacterium]
MFRSIPLRRPAAFGGWSAILLILALPVALAQERLVDETMQTQSAADEAAARVQTQISQLADETTGLVGDYRVTIQQLDRTQIYNQNLAALVQDQEEEKVSIQQQLENFVETEQDIVPLMQDMISTLEQFIQLDMPFLLEERTNRVRTLRDNMSRADITISEKYRQIMEAYQIEAQFGRDVEAYSGPLDLGEGPPRTVDFLRVGRMLLAYQSADGAETGFWNKLTRRWEQLPDEYRRSISDGLTVARQQGAPEMLRLPVPSPEVPE